MRRFCLPVILYLIFISLSESFIDQEDLAGKVGILEEFVKELQGKWKLLENQTKCGKYIELFIYFIAKFYMAVMLSSWPSQHK